MQTWPRRDAERTKRPVGKSRSELTLWEFIAWGVIGSVAVYYARKWVGR